MTAVATFISKDGVAIAADSASTITAGGDIKKVYNTATKVFHLSDNVPVAAVIWGDAGHRGVPWSILIREFGQTIKKPCPRFEGYPEAFLEYLKKNRGLFKGGRKADSFREELTAILQEIAYKYQEEGGKAKRNCAVLLSQVISYFRDYHDKTTPYAYGELNDIIKKAPFRAAADGYIREVFRGIKLSQENYLALAHIAALKYADTERNDSGILLAGYGSRDIFPSQAIISDGVFDKSFSIGEYLGIDNEKSTAILRLLAQHGPANTFIEGIDDGIRHFISKQMEDMADDFVSMMGNSLNTKARTKLVKDAEKILTEKRANIDAYIESLHGERFRANLEFMPLGEMAQLVEMMVKLTAYHSRISEAHETVGGPVAVAVISRDKVFSWAKSK